MISPSMRPWMATKVVVVGAESTGKTTLARRLAEHFRTSWAPETGRAYLEAKGKGTGRALCTKQDLITIARRQMNAEREACQRATRALVFLDTDLMVTAAFGDYYFDACPPAVVRIANRQAYALHLLCSTQVPWEDDGTRDCSQADREWFNARYEAEMRWRKQPYVKLPPDPEEAFKTAVQAVSELPGISRAL